MAGVLCSTLTGCGKSASEQSGLLLNQTGAAANVGMPAEVNAEKELLDVSVLAELPRSNPFASLLVPQDQEKDPTKVATNPTDPTNPNGTTAPPPDQATQPVVPPPPTYLDPFNGFGLGGVIYLGKRSLAIITLPDGSSKIVHVGDILQGLSSGNSSSTSTTTGDGKSETTNLSPTLKIKIAKIDKKSVVLQVLKAPSGYPSEFKTTTLYLESLVGYQPKASGSSSGSSSEKSSPKTASGESASSEASTSPVSGVSDEINSLLGGSTSSSKSSGKQ